MTKRTAMLAAAGVVLALFGGSVALSFSLAGNGAAEAGQRAGRQEPIVRRIERTIRVEKQAKGARSATQVITLTAPASTGRDASSFADEHDDDAYEHDDDDAYEHDDDAYEHDDSYEEGDDD